MVRNVLVEKMGTAFSEEAEEAKAAFDKAKADIAMWDAEDAKKKKRDAKLEELGLTPDSDSKVAKAIKKQFPYDPKIIAKRQQYVAASVKARAKYLVFFPLEGDDIKRGASDRIQPTGDIPDNKKAYAKISDLSPMTWYKWDDPRWKTATSKIQYRSDADGTGPGESRLATIFGAQVQGGSVSFDIVTSDGGRWEVKQLLKATDLIRPGTEGLAMFEKPRYRLNLIMRQLRNFNIITTKFKLHETLTDPKEIKLLNIVNNFIDNEFLNIVSKGEISKGRFKALFGIMTMLNALKDRWSLNGDGKIDTSIGISDKKIDVDPQTFIDVSKQVQKARPDVDVTSDIEEKKLALSALRDESFDDPKAFFDEWYELIKPARVFEQVQGVFIVNDNGFNFVPESEYNTAFEFSQLSQGKPRFSFVYYNGHGKASEAA